MEALFQQTDYDKIGYDPRRDHVIMGSGSGQDLVYQDGKFFTSFGKQISPTTDGLREAGIRPTPEIQTFLQKINLRRKEALLRKKLEEKLKEVEARERARIANGYSNSATASESLDESDLEDQIEKIDLSGVDSLLDEDEEEDEPEEEAEKPSKPTRVNSKRKGK